MTPVSEARKRANEKYVKNTYDELKVRVPKGKKEAIKEHAEKQNESLNSFVNRAIDQAIEQDNQK